MITGKSLSYSLINLAASQALYTVGVNEVSPTRAGLQVLISSINELLSKPSVGLSTILTVWPAFSSTAAMYARLRGSLNTRYLVYFELFYARRDGE